MRQRPDPNLRKASGFEVLTDQDWQTVLNINLLAAVRLDRAFLPGMIERKSGVVIHVSSISHPVPFSNSTLALAAANRAAYISGVDYAIDGGTIPTVG